MIAIGYDAAGLYALAVFAVPLLLMRKTQEAYLSHTRRSAQKLRQAAETIHTQNVSLEQANRLLKERSTAAMESLSATVDARDAYTAGHSRRVPAARPRDRPRARPLARRARSARSRRAVPRHRQARDPGLDPAEAGEPDGGGVGADAAARRRGRAHHRPARASSATPSRRSATTTSASTARAIPTGSEGEEIPLGARIIHVADALDSMLTTRIYRAARPLDEALTELRRGRRARSSARAASAALERILPLDALTIEPAAARNWSLSAGSRVRTVRAPCAGRTVRSGRLATGESALHCLHGTGRAVTPRWQASIRRHLPRSRPESASATRMRRSSRS